jgi:RNase H-like domain found in reverse transcriptase/Reverse transcriptase (RNA-dependent DNA polymerase)/Integrase zinc binding domain/Chromo (CHRromatin Organisation MOdifier) domain/Retroviral aspartyl protease
MGRRDGSKSKSLCATTTDESAHLTTTVLLNGIPLTAMIDSGAQENYISPRIVNREHIEWTYKKEPYSLSTVEGTTVAYEDGLVSRETAQLPMNISGRDEEITFDITDIAEHELILGIPWLRNSNPVIDWTTGQLFWRTAPPRQVIRKMERDIAKSLGLDRVTEQRHSKRKPSNRPQEKTKALMVFVKQVIQEEMQDAMKHIPEEYRQYASLFQEELDTGLPEHSQWDHEIPLKEGVQLRFSKIYPLNQEQQEALREYIRENLRKGYIRPSTSPVGYPILFVPKKNGKLRLCVDYRHLNDNTIKNRYPLPLIPELRDRLHGANWFTALDLKGAYNLIRIKEGEEWKTAFRTRYGLYEYLVMPFGLTNAPASFQTMINSVLKDYLDDFVIVYLDDILIFSKTIEEHKEHVHQVLRKLREAKLLVEPAKSEFHTQRVKYLGYIIEPGKIGMDPDKIKAIKEWPEPKNVTDVRAFQGYVNFYRQFIKGYGDIARPLTDMTRKDTPFNWDDKPREAFEELKSRVTSEPILMMPDPSKPFEAETDASDGALGGQLGQRDDEGRLHPVAFFSKKLSGPELNYPIHDKELMAIIEAFKEWKHYLSGTTHQVKVYTDHKNLTYFTTTKELNKRQTRWSEFLSEFNFQIVYRKGSENGRADALSRRSDHMTETPVASTQLLKTNTDGSLELAHKGICYLYKVQPDQEWESRMTDAYEHDDYIRQNPDTMVKNGKFYHYQGRIYVPEKLQNEEIKRIHEAKAHGHNGITKTVKRIQQNYNFPGILTKVKKVIHNCVTCARSKAPRHKPYGELQALPTPDRAWRSIALDFVVKLPTSTEPMTGTKFDSILVITDRLTKFGHFIPYKEATNSEELAYVFLRTIISIHGLPDEIVTDRGTTFTSKFWQSLMNQLGANHKLSTAYHPQTDGQTERLNQTLEQYLRCYVNYQQDNWVSLLPLAQFADNSAPTETTKISPFYANYGFQPEAYREPRTTTSISEKAQIKAQDLQKLHQLLQHELSFVQQRMTHYANQKRLKGPTFQRGDMVYLIRRNIKTTRPSDKLDFKKLGPFPIVKVISQTNYELSLPKGMRIHPIFHISLLEPAPADADIQDSIEVIPEQEEEYEVERILDTEWKDNEIKYLVRWKGYEPNDDTWEPVTNLRNCQHLVRKFHLRNPDRPKPDPKSKSPQHSRQ